MYFHRLKTSRVAVKLRSADLSVVTSDELEAGDTFGEECMLDERRYFNVAVTSITAGEAGESGERVGGSSSAQVAAVGRSYETYQTLEVRSNRAGSMEGMGGLWWMLWCILYFILFDTPRLAKSHAHHTR